MTSSLIRRFLNNEFQTYDAFASAYDEDILAQLSGKPIRTGVPNEEETTKILYEIADLLGKFYQLRMWSNTPLLTIADVRLNNRKHYTREVASRALLNAKCRDFKLEFEAGRNKEIETEFDMVIGAVLEAINKELKVEIENPDRLDDTEAVKYYERVLFEQIDSRLAALDRSIADIRIVRNDQIASLHV